MKEELFLLTNKYRNDKRCFGFYTSNSWTNNKWYDLSLAQNHLNKRNNGLSLKSNGIIDITNSDGYYKTNINNLIENTPNFAISVLVELYPQTLTSSTSYFIALGSATNFRQVLFYYSSNRYLRINVQGYFTYSESSVITKKRILSIFYLNNVIRIYDNNKQIYSYSGNMLIGKDYIGVQYLSGCSECVIPFAIFLQNTNVTEIFTINRALSKIYKI